MNNTGAARKSEKPEHAPAKIVPFSRRDSDLILLKKREEQERIVADELDSFRRAGGSLRQTIEVLAGKYKFFDRERFIDQLTERAEKIPSSISLVRYVVSTFMVYEFTNHQDLTMKFADFCLSKSEGYYNMASAYSTLLSKVVEVAVGAGVQEEARRDMLERTIELSGRFGTQSFAALRVISEVVLFSYVIHLSSRQEEQETSAKERLPLPAADPFRSFLLALENIFAVTRDPSLITGFLSSCMEMSRAYRAEQFLLGISIIGSASKLNARENKKLVEDALAALNYHDLNFLKTIETNMLRNQTFFPSD